MLDETNNASLPSISLWRFALASLRGDWARRQHIARMLELPPPRYRVGVELRLRVPMADGTTLAADHYFPKTTGEYPAILIHSPLGRRWEKMPFSFAYMFAAQRFAERGYHVIVQSARVRDANDFLPTNEEADGVAGAEWIARQPWFNGTLALWGPSYLGFVQWAIAGHALPHVKAIIPSLTTANMRTLFYQNDAFALENILTVLTWFTAVERPVLQRFRSQERQMQAAYAHLPLATAETIAIGAPNQTFRDALAHPAADDEYWHAVDMRGNLPRITAPAHLIGGWHDLFLRDILRDYAALCAAGHTPHLTIGPWGHFDVAAAMTQIREGLRWFDVQLKGAPATRTLPVQIYVMGANTWLSLPAWPPATQPQVLHLRSHGQLAADAPGAAETPDLYTYNPLDPTPAIGGNRLHGEAGTRDVGALLTRPDVLSYTSDILDDDLTLIGSAQVDLWLRSSAPSTDFVAKLCDVAPDGTTTHICDGMVRLVDMDATDRPTSITLWPTAYRLARGHRLRLLVMSGAHPRWARNLGTGEDANGTKYRMAEQTLYHDTERPSRLTLPVVIP